MKRLLIWSGITCIILIAGFFVLHSVVQQRIRRQVRDLSPFIQVNFAAVHTNLFFASVSFDSLDIKFIPYPDHPEFFHHVAIHKLSLRGISLLGVLFKQKLNANELVIDNAFLSVDSALLASKDSVQVGIIQKINTPFRQIAIHHLIISKMQAVLRNGRDNRAMANGEISMQGIAFAKRGGVPGFRQIELKLYHINYVFKDTRITLSRLEISSPKAMLSADSIRIGDESVGNFNAEILSLKLSGFDVLKSIHDQVLVAKQFSVDKCSASMNHYHINISSARFLGEPGNMMIHGIQVFPLFKTDETGRIFGHQVDRLNASIPEIEIIKPSMTDLFHRQLVAEKIRITGMDAHIFRDRRLPRPGKVIPLPMDYLRELPSTIRIGAFELASANVEYEELPKTGYGKTGTLKLERINLHLSPLLNHQLSTDPSFARASLDASIMGSGTAHCDMSMPLEKNQPYHLAGKIENLELTRLNSSSENLGKIRIKSGLLNFLSFDFTMTRERSTGKIIGAYHQLVIEPLKKHKEEKNIADVASFMLRHFIIPINKDSSLPESKRTGLVDYQRDPTRMVSYYFLQSLLMGIKKSFKLGFLLPK